MRVAVLADIHGHLPALDAVLADIDAGPPVDAIVLNGDIATGPMPAETLDRLAALGDRAIWVHGNAERELVAAHDGQLGPDLPDEVRLPTAYCGDRITRRHRDLIAELPMTVTLDVTGLGPTLFCHATTRSDTEMVLVDSPVERFRQAYGGTPDTVVLGHTHMPFDRLADRRRFVNPGSVGMPYGSGPGAYWALLGPDVSLRCTRYDAAGAADLFRSAAPDYPGLDAFIAENVLTTPSDAEALAVFTALI